MKEEVIGTIFSFLEKLDRLYESGAVNQIEPFLKNGLEQYKEEERWTVLSELAGYYRGVGRYKESASSYHQLLEELEREGKKQEKGYVTTQMNLAGTLRLSGKLNEAKELFEKCLALFSPNDYEFVCTLNNLSLVYQEQGKLDEAIRLSLQALSWLEKQGAPEHEIATSLTNLGILYLRMGKLEEAEKYLKNAMVLYRGMEHTNIHYGAALSAWGTLCIKKENFQEAKDVFSESLKWTKYFFGKSVEYEMAKKNLALACEKAGEKKELS